MPTKLLTPAPKKPETAKAVEVKAVQGAVDRNRPDPWLSNDARVAEINATSSRSKPRWLGPRRPGGWLKGNR